MASSFTFTLLEDSDDFGRVFSGVACALGCLLWTALWLSVHLLWLLCASHSVRCEDEEKRREDDMCSLVEQRRGFYIRKLRRMQVYCIAASASGITVFLQCFFESDPLQAMLTSFGALQQFLFTMAVGHWMVTLWEDSRTRCFLAQGLSAEAGGGLAFFPLNICLNGAQIMYLMYTLHHIVTIFAYTYSLCTHQMGGVMVQGLLFELPVVFMLRREIGVGQRELPHWLQSSTATQAHWILTYVAFILGRGPAECLWVISMVVSEGQEQLADLLSLPNLVVYHLLAIFFTSLNLRIFVLFICWHGQDVARARNLEDPQPESGSPALPTIPKE